MIRQIYQNSNSDEDDVSLEDDESNDTTTNEFKDVYNTNYDENSNNIYMIMDIKTYSYKNSKIKIHLSLMNKYGEKTYKVIEDGISFDVFIGAHSKDEKIEQFLNELQCLNNTPEYLDYKYTAMGYSANPLPVWRLNIDRNKLDYIHEFCERYRRSMFLNTELNNALPLAQKSIGTYMKIKDSANKYISYDTVLKPDKEEMPNVTDYDCRKVSIDIEVITPKEWKLFPDAQQFGCEIIIIACTFQKNDNPYETIVLYTDKKARNVHIENDQVERQFKMFINEHDMLHYFIGMINPYNTDLITGWNVRNFDLKYIYNRCVKFYPNLSEKFSTWSMDDNNITFKETIREGQKITLVECFGIIILDMFDYNKVNVKAKSYKLKDIARQFLKEDKQKIEMEYKDISKSYENGSDEEFSRLLEYCSVDAEIVLDIMAVQKVWNNIESMADICHVPLYYVFNHGVMMRNRCMISQFINETSDYLLPYKHEHPFVKYAGGFVYEPVVGFHTNPVFTLDFNSFGPTTMMAFNICTTTLIKVDKMQIPKDYIQQLPTNKDGEFLPDELSQLSRDTDDNLTINITPYMKNVGFVSSKNRKGILPPILEILIKKRKEIQLELKQTTCTDKRKQLDAKQLAYKLCANAIYGMLGCSFSPLYIPDVAASVTGFGRFLSFIKRKLINKYMQEENVSGRIIYGDTDSVMVEINERSIAETRDIAIKYAERITKDIGIHPIKTEYEKIFCPFLIHKKKHYIGAMYTNDCSKHDKIEYKGNEMVRSDNCSLTTNIMKNIIDILFFTGNNTDEKIDEIGKYLRISLNTWSKLYMLYKTNNHENITLDLLKEVVEDGKCSKKLSKEKYKNKLAHVAVYQRMKNSKQYNVGDRITYCIANTEFTDKIKPKNIAEMAYDIDEFLNPENKLYLSIHYYLDSCIRKPLSRLFETQDPKFEQKVETVLTELFPPLNKIEKIMSSPPLNKTEVQKSRKRKIKQDPIEGELSAAKKNNIK